jgi:hypothetical protein
MTSSGDFHSKLNVLETRSAAGLRMGSRWSHDATTCKEELDPASVAVENAETCFDQCDAGS